MSKEVDTQNINNIGGPGFTTCAPAKAASTFKSPIHVAPHLPNQGGGVFSCFIPFALAEYCNDNNLTRQLGYFIYFKHYHRNSKIYPASIRQLGKKFNCSPSTIHKRIKELIALGWAIKHDNGVIELRKKKDITLELTGRKSQGNGVRIKFDKALPARQQLYIIESTLVIQKIKQQQYIIAKKVSAVNSFFKTGFKSNSDIRKSNQLIKECRAKKINLTNITIDNLKKQLGINKHCTLSNRSIGKLLNKSQHTGLRRQKIWNKLHLIKSTPLFKEGEQISQQGFILKRMLGFADAGSFFQNGREVFRLANKIECGLKVM